MEIGVISLPQMVMCLVQPLEKCGDQSSTEETDDGNTFTCLNLELYVFENGAGEPNVVE